MAERIDTFKIINKIVVTDQRPAAVSSWSSVDEYIWRQRRGQSRLAELRDHFKRYAPEIARQLDRGLITRRQATELTDTHCYNVFRGKPEQI